ncbi:MAG: hypothetical protein LBF16_12950 [Pseudomonadales bacterium]|jgi:hypothetical protein|nr:hypothetical protein [Pseudomonadales bacterium]
MIENKPLIHDIGAYVRNLAQIHHITATQTYADVWAEHVTAHAGDDVQCDEVENLVIALKKANKVTGVEMVQILSRYLRERSRHV